MNIQEAMKQRHMVRKYQDKPIPSDIVSKLQKRLQQSKVVPVRRTAP